MYKRYGKFKISDYSASWMVLGLMIAFGVACLLLKLPGIYLIVPILYSATLIYSIWNPNREYFEIADGIINVKKGKREKQIKIPKEISLIISPVDVCPPLSIRTAVGNTTHMLDGKYAVSILMKMDMHEMLEKVHRGHIKQYTTSTIKNAFEEYKYFYSFVCEDLLLNELLRERKANILIPKSMINKVLLEKFDLEIFIDSEC